MTDIMLKKAAAESAALFADDLAAKALHAPKHSFSYEFEAKIKKLKAKANHMVLYRSLLRVASVLLILFVGSGVWLTFDAQARKAAVGWIKRQYGSSFHFWYNEDSYNGDSTKPDNAYYDAQNHYEIKLLPEGYKENSVFGIIGGYERTYADNTNRFLHLGYVYDPQGAAWYPMPKLSIHIKTEVNGSFADLFVSTQENFASVIVWKYDPDNTGFYISGFMSEEDLIQAAESVTRLDESMHESESYTPVNYEPSYIPPGYTVFHQSIDTGASHLIYANEAGRFLKISIIAPSEAGVFSTNAGDRIIKTKVGRYEAEFIFFDDPATSASLYWCDENDNMFYVSGYFDKEEILKIANSIYE